MTIYNYSAAAPNGDIVELSRYTGKPVLIVNTASECGYTPQYADLQKLYEAYKDRGFVVLGFPCNQFGGQEPGSAEEVVQFCSINYGVTFPIFDKVDVKGPNAHPLFTYLTAQSGGEIKWNFTKFLVGGDGENITLYESSVQPEQLGPDIERLLA